MENIIATFFFLFSNQLKKNQLFTLFGIKCHWLSLVWYFSKAAKLIFLNLLYRLLLPPDFLQFNMVTFSL